MLILLHRSGFQRLLTYQLIERLFPELCVEKYEIKLASPQASIRSPKQASSTKKSDEPPVAPVTPNSNSSPLPTPSPAKCSLPQNRGPPGGWGSRSRPMMQVRRITQQEKQEAAKKRQEVHTQPHFNICLASLFHLYRKPTKNLKPNFKRPLAFLGLFG